MSKEIWYFAELPHYFCAFSCVDGVITNAAPIMHWALDRPLEDYVQWAEKKGGTIEPLGHQSSLIPADD